MSRRAPLKLGLVLLAAVVAGACDATAPEPIIIKLSVSDTILEMDQGTNTDITFKVTTSEETERLVEFELVSVPPRFEAAFDSEVLFAPDSVVTLSVAVAPDAPVGKHTVAVLVRVTRRIDILEESVPISVTVRTPE